MSLREAASTALFARLDSSLAARNPAPVIRRNETVPQRLPAGGLVVLRDGESVAETPILSPLAFAIEHRAEIEVMAADHSERGAFLAMHQTLGLTVLLLVVLSEARALAIEGSSMTIGGMVLHASMFGLWVPPNTPYPHLRRNLLATDTGSPRTQRRLER